MSPSVLTASGKTHVVKHARTLVLTKRQELTYGVMKHLLARRSK